MWMKWGHLIVSIKLLSDTFSSWGHTRDIKGALFISQVRSVQGTLVSACDRHWGAATAGQTWTSASMEEDGGLWRFSLCTGPGCMAVSLPWKWRFFMFSGNVKSHILCCLSFLLGLFKIKSGMTLLKHHSHEYKCLLRMSCEKMKIFFSHCMKYQLLWNRIQCAQNPDQDPTFSRDVKRNS